MSLKFQSNIEYSRQTGGQTRGTGSCLHSEIGTLVYLTHLWACIENVFGQVNQLNS